MTTPNGVARLVAKNYHEGISASKLIITITVTNCYKSSTELTTFIFVTFKV